ncbi:UNVERIFIED_CONTAM: hypothetical protein ABIC26_003794 [Paenibacillus sp. PvR008]
MRKSAFAAMTTVSLLSFSFGGQMFAAGNPFKDLDSISGKDKIISLQNQGLFKGVSDTQFLPASKVTAAQGIQLISGGFQLSLAAIDFNKVPQASGLFAHVKVNTLDASKKFNPKSEITRAEAAIMLYNALEYLNAHKA